MWKYKGKDIKDIKDVPSSAIGFVYIIMTEKGKKYIGKKSLYTLRKRNFGKRELAKMSDKRQKTYEHVKKESNWLTYSGSNTELLTDINNETKISKEILKFCENKKQLTYYEAKYQFFYDVLADDSYYNNNILGSFFKKDL